MILEYFYPSFPITSIGFSSLEGPSLIILTSHGHQPYLAQKLTTQDGNHNNSHKSYYFFSQCSILNFKYHHHSIVITPKTSHLYAICKLNRIG